MGAKGDRAAKEPIASKLYADGMTLTGISEQLDISDTTLRRWKEESRVPGDKLDGWDKGRQQKRGNIQRLKDLFERQLEYVEGLQPSEVSASMMDTLSKLGALVERWDKVESEIRRKVLEEAADAIEETAKQQGLTKKDSMFWREQVLGIR